MQCPSCGRENAERNYYCSYCGEKLKVLKGSPKEIKRRCKYILDLEVELNEDKEEENGYVPYRVKQKK